MVRHLAVKKLALVKGDSAITFPLSKNAQPVSRADRNGLSNSLRRCQQNPEYKISIWYQEWTEAGR